MPVTLALVTIIRFDSSPMRRPCAWRSSWAIRSKRGSVMPNSVRRRVRISVSIRVVQESMRSIALVQAYTAEASEHKRFELHNRQSLAAEIRTAQASKTYKRSVQTLIEASSRCDLLVLGSRHRSGLSGLAEAHVGRDVLHHARCPVLVVPQGARVPAAA